jgi:hypothetical protein
MKEGAAEFALPLAEGGDYSVATTLIATTRHGRTMQLQLTPQSLTVAGPPQPPPEPAHSPAPAAPEGADFAQVATIVGVGNLGLGALLGPLWFVMRRREPPSKGMSL